jgi:hypothetical protein
MDRETQRIMLIKSGLVAMTGTTGWDYFKGMAKNVVEQAINEALEEEDPIKGESKRLKARALQKGLADLFNAVEVAKSFEQYTGDDGFDLDPQVVQQITEL